MRGRKRTWIKLYCYERLHGSVSYQLDEAEQSVWDKLLCLAGLCGQEGGISDNDGRAYPHSFIAHELHTTVELLETVLDKCKVEGRISENSSGINITNWSVYQSEYQRQRPYRQANKAGQRIHKVCPSCGYKGFTDEEHCPECEKKGQGIKLEKDYAAGKYGHMTQR